MIFSSSSLEGVRFRKGFRNKIYMSDKKFHQR